MASTFFLVGLRGEQLRRDQPGDPVGRAVPARPGEHGEVGERDRLGFGVGQRAFGVVGDAVLAGGQLEDLGAGAVLELDDSLSPCQETLSSSVSACAAATEIAASPGSVTRTENSTSTVARGAIAS